MTALERAARWAALPCFDEATRAEAARILRDPDALARAFGSELAFGTGGLRGILGTGTNRMNRYTVARATAGLADSLPGGGGRSVVIAYDSRHGSQEFALVAAGVLARRGLTARLFSRLMPTPVLSFTVRELRADAGVMITASHNPAEYNGYKVYGPDGCQITDKAAAAVTEAIATHEYGETEWLAEAEAREKQLLVPVPEAILEAYVQRTLACRARPGERAPVTVCYTPLNGAGLEPVRAVLGAMPGVTVVEAEEQSAPDGDFPTCPKPNPELKTALASAIAAAKEKGADLVIANDPDGDRLGVAARDAAGDFTLLTGNEVGLLLLESVLAARKAAGTLPERPVVIKTIVTGDLAFPVAAAYGATVVETLTGFKYIGEEIGRMEERGEAERFVFGFEESCGYLAGTHVRDKDGVMAAMLVCELAQRAAAEGRTLTGMLSSLYARYGRIGTRLVNVDIAGTDPMAEMNRLMGELRARPPFTLAGAPVTAVRDYRAGVDGLPPADVLTFETANGKAIVRPSGTEPKVKAYLSAPVATDTETSCALDALEADVRARLA